MITMLIAAFAFLLGLYWRNILSTFRTFAEQHARELPDTSVLPIHGTLPCELPDWAIAGEYLIRDNGRMYNTSLSAYARYLMGELADVVLLRPATLREAYTYRHATPNGRPYSYTRVRSLRTHHTRYQTDAALLDWAIAA